MARTPIVRRPQIYDTAIFIKRAKYGHLSADMRDMLISDAQISVSFVSCTFYHMLFDKCDFEGAVFQDCIFDSCEFDSISLEACVFDDCVFRDATLEDVKTEDCYDIFDRCFFYDSVFHVTDRLDPQSFTDCSFNQVRGLHYAQCSWDGHGIGNRTLTAIKANNQVIYQCGCFRGNYSALMHYIDIKASMYAASRKRAARFVRTCINKRDE